MTTPQEGDHAAAETTVVTTGMGTGSDAGAPGERSAPEPLGGDDQELLDQLRDDDADPVLEAVEDGDTAARAADDDAPLPSAAAPSSRADEVADTDTDADTPEFAEPR